MKVDEKKNDRLSCWIEVVVSCLGPMALPLFLRVNASFARRRRNSIAICDWKAMFQRVKLSYHTSSQFAILPEYPLE